MQEPKGIPFYNIKDDTTVYAKLEPQIQGYINSSNMGINASRDQDFGWRLAPGWVKKVKAFKRDEDKMERLAGKNGDQPPTDTQILYAIYGAQLRMYSSVVDEDDTPFEQKYNEAISSNAKPKSAPRARTAPKNLPKVEEGDEEEDESKKS